VEQGAVGMPVRLVVITLDYLEPQILVAVEVVQVIKLLMLAVEQAALVLFFSNTQSLYPQ
jgi:hypothetical protein